jgi:hypothetical protein
MKRTFILTESQRMALCTLLSDYARRTNAVVNWPAIPEFVDCSVDPQVTTTPEELLAVFMLPGNVVESDAALQSRRRVPT